jgi:uncharacterized small protein (DUF1192 family)
MDIEEFASKKTPSIALRQEELQRLSIEEIEERIGLLHAEIRRCEATKADKQATKASADRFFKI